MAGEGVLATLESERVNELVRVLTSVGFHARHSPALRFIDGQGIAQFTFQPADAAMVLRENRDDIDFTHLHREVIRQGVTAEYREMWREAFPDESVPDLG